MVIFGCHDGFLYCLDQDKGNLMWKTDFSSEIYANPFVIGENKIACTSVDGLLVVVNLNGQMIYKKDLFGSKNTCYSSPIIYERCLFIGSRDNNIYKFELK